MKFRTSTPLAQHGILLPENLYFICSLVGARGGVVVLVLRYKPAGRGFDGVIGIFQ